MKSLLKTGKTYDTVGGYQVTLLDKEYASHDLIIYKGIVNLGENQYYAYFSDTGDCIVFDNVVMKLIGNVAIELFDIVLSDEDITEAYDHLSDEDSDESIISIIEEALNEFKNDLKSDSTSDETHTENPSCDDCDDCTCVADDEFIAEIVRNTIAKLKQSIDLLHDLAIVNPYDKDVWKSYNMMLGQLNLWVSYLR